MAKPKQTIIFFLADFIIQSKWEKQQSTYEMTHRPTFEQMGIQLHTCVCLCVHRPAGTFQKTDNDPLDLLPCTSCFISYKSVHESRGGDSALLGHVSLTPPATKSTLSIPNLLCGNIMIPESGKADFLKKFPECRFILHFPTKEETFRNVCHEYMCTDVTEEPTELSSLRKRIHRERNLKIRSDEGRGSGNEDFVKQKT